MKNKNYKIDTEIYVVFIIVIGISVFNAIYSSLNISRNQEVTSRIITVEIPSLQSLEKMNLLVTRSSMYTTNWVYLNGDREDKELLKRLQAIDYPELKNNLLSLMNQWNDVEGVDSMNSVFRHFEELVVQEKQIMNLLVNFDDYEDPMKKFTAEGIIEEQILPHSANIIGQLNALIYKKKVQAELKHHFVKASSIALMWSVLGIAILIVVVILIAAFYMSNNIIVPTMKLKNYILQMGKGETPEMNLKSGKNAVGQMVEAVQTLAFNLQKTAHFAHSIREANYDEEFQPLSTSDELGNALIQMRASLKKADEDNKLRTWISDGTEKINETLRENTDDIDRLTDEIISTLVKYSSAYHGGIYLVETDELRNDQWIQLHGSYALNSQSKAKTRIEIGEGLLGQTIKEGETIYLQNIPSSYTIINSALGESPATHALLIPLKHHGIVYGALELASFSEFPVHQIRFLENIGETIATTIYSVKANTTTKNLLEETRKQAERLSVQEEELRSTNDELSYQSRLLQASEEELKLSNLELKRKARELEQQNEILEQAREALSMKAKELEQNSKYKSEFLANMSHELRTPLNSVLILAKLLTENKNNNLNEKQVEYARVIHKSGSDLLVLINDILDLSKIEAGKIELILEDTPLQSIKKDHLDLFGELALDKKIEFSIEVQSDLPDSIITDRMRLDQVIKNLLSNAFKFTPAGGNVTMKMKRPEKGLLLSSPNLMNKFDVIEISVSDTGIGIPAEKQQLIFEAFQQADGSTNRSYGGTGLGLSISKMLISMLGGEIHLTSEKGKGSTFYLFLPVKHNVRNDSQSNISKGEIENPITIGKSLLPAVALSSHPATFSLLDDRSNIGSHDKVLLIVEDDLHFAKVLMDVAHDKNYKAIVATQGEEGLSYASLYNPSAIIMDMQLPGMDGWTVLKQIKEDEKLCHIPVHIMSAMDRQRLGLEMGATAYLRKPLDKKDLDDAFFNIDNAIEIDVKKVLLVEDSQMDQEIVMNLIFNKEKNTRIDSVVTSDEAHEYLDRYKYDCIILDLDLGKGTLDGLKLLEDIKTKGRHVSTPVIVFTGSRISESEEQRIKNFTGSLIRKNGETVHLLIDEVSSFLHQVKQDDLQEGGKTIIPANHEDILKGRCVLFADDDMRNVFALTNVLEDQGMVVLTAANGKEAIDKLLKNPQIEILLLDIMMPEMDGYETMMEIRKTEKIKDLPIIAMTAKALPGEREKSFHCGASDYISKPIQIDQLLSIMRVWLYKG